jgi:succinate dehydrogenase / fumarate reductase, flavoprotein subunit
MAALERQESRGGHTREDFPAMSPEWRKINLVLSADESGSAVTLRRQPIVPMREDLLELFDKSELKKYMTEEELVGVGSPASASPASSASGEEGH